MKQTIIRYALVFIPGVLLGIWLAQLFCGNGHSAGPTVTVNPALLEAKLSATQKVYDGKIDSIDRLNTTLRTQVFKTQTALVQVKRQNSDLKQTIEQLLTVHDTTTDTLARLDNCDSLAASMEDMLVLNSTKDSLYESLTGDLRSQVALRDSVISLKQTQYDSLQVGYNKALVYGQQLLQENLQQRKAIKKQKRGKGFLAVALVVVGSLFTWHAIK